MQLVPVVENMTGNKEPKLYEGEIRHSWKHMDDDYSITEGWFRDPDLPMLAVRVPLGSAKNLAGKEFDATDIRFDLDEETARRFHRLIGSWLEEIHE